VLFTAGLTDEDPGLPLVDLYAVQHGMFLLAGGADFCFHVYIILVKSCFINSYAISKKKLKSCKIYCRSYLFILPWASAMGIPTGPTGLASAPKTKQKTLAA
jgi:hypothetical protein